MIVILSVPTVKKNRASVCPYFVVLTVSVPAVSDSNSECPYFDRECP